MTRPSYTCIMIDRAFCIRCQVLIDLSYSPPWLEVFEPLLSSSVCPLKHVQWFDFYDRGGFLGVIICLYKRRHVYSIFLPSCRILWQSTSVSPPKAFTRVLECHSAGSGFIFGVRVLLKYTLIFTIHNLNFIQMTLMSLLICKTIT